MRKIAFVKKEDSVRKLMIYESDKGFYLFGFDCVEDNPCVWDLFFLELGEAEEEANDKYEIAADDWINIAEPALGSQHDLIAKYRFNDKSYTFGAWTANERLFLTGLRAELDRSIANDKSNAIKILKSLLFDSKSIDLIINR